MASAIMLAVVIYKNYRFKNNPLPLEIQEKIIKKQHYLRNLAFQKFGIKNYIPVIINDKMPDNLFGLAVFTKEREIKIILNQNRFQESVEYMIDYVLPHEYAHTVMFALGDFSQDDGGHTKKWQNICLALEGKKCDRYVNHKDVIFGKVPF